MATVGCRCVVADPHRGMVTGEELSRLPEPTPMRSGRFILSSTRTGYPVNCSER
jgi:hypothetical protein